VYSGVLSPAANTTSLRAISTRGNFWDGRASG